MPADENVPILREIPCRSSTSTKDNYGFESGLCNICNQMGEGEPIMHLVSALYSDKLKATDVDCKGAQNQIDQVED